MLSIKLGQTNCYVLPHEVCYIDYVENVTPVPFIEGYVEGLTNYNGQPLLQIDVAGKLGLKQEDKIGLKRLIVTTEEGHAALRVDEVLNFMRSKGANRTSDKPKETVRVLRLKEIVPRLLKTKSLSNSVEPGHLLGDRMARKLFVLLVVSGGKTVALLPDNILHIQPLEGIESLEGKAEQGDFLIKVNDHFLPTHSLAKLLGLNDAGEESIAIIVKSKQSTWALRVEQVMNMERVQKVYSSGSGGKDLWCVTQKGQIQELINTHQLAEGLDLTAKTRLWYVTQEGGIRELTDANDLLGEHCDSEPLPSIAIPEAMACSAPKVTGRFMSDGLRMYCGTSCFLLPLTMSARTVRDLNILEMSAKRFPEGNRSAHMHRIPWVDAAVFLFDKQQQKIEVNVAIRFPSGAQILLGVSRVALPSSLFGVENWKSINLPSPASFMFDAACFDAPSGIWILRIADDIQFRDLPWKIKKSFIKAVKGWFDRRLMRSENK